MNFRNAWIVVFLLGSALVSAEPRTVAGAKTGPVVALVSGASGAVNLSHEGVVTRGWIFPGPYTSAVILAGPLDTVDWDGEAVVLVPGGNDPVAAAQGALSLAKAPRLLLINPDGAAQVVKAPDEEKQMDYDAASAATEE
jgi:hypothetical protein